jgi:ubiquinone/menaquinone biosynthesis C-methylase UbiE
LSISDRHAALCEAYRVIIPGGILFAAAVSRFASLLDGLSRGSFRDARFKNIVAADLATGQHRNPTDNPAYFKTAYFHRPEELAQEVGEAGFKRAQVLAIEGPVWSAAHFHEIWADPGDREKVMQFLSLIENEPSIQGSSAHIIVVAYR